MDGVFDKRVRGIVITRSDPNQEIGQILRRFVYFLKIKIPWFRVVAIELMNLLSLLDECMYVRMNDGQVTGMLSARPNVTFETRHKMKEKERK
jgi:hypothetical protein